MGRHTVRSKRGSRKLDQASPTENVTEARTAVEVVRDAILTNVGRNDKDGSNAASPRTDGARVTEARLQSLDFPTKPI